MSDDNSGWTQSQLDWPTHFHVDAGTEKILAEIAEVRRRARRGDLQAVSMLRGSWFPPKQVPEPTPPRETEVVVHRHSPGKPRAYQTTQLRTGDDAAAKDGAAKTIIVK